MAADIMREGQLGDFLKIGLMKFLVSKVFKGDIQAMEDLTYGKRREFLKKYSLPKELPVVSFHTEADISPASVTTLFRVADQIPICKGQLGLPLSAAMAACAQHLQVRYGTKSDGLVTRCDAEVPGSIVVRPNLKLDHAWMVLPLVEDDPSKPNASQVCEALLMLLVEAGQNKLETVGYVG
ncbi:hypothetical protein M0R45_035026 [Rubus argutus]|uniref:Uncharacterized protein n=1 Tax=Rubus argutus TaxID=59490 RepID=A0AAW1VUX3_RUBAR